MVTQSGWEPANATERAMADALVRGDTPAYFQAVLDATLYLPAFPGTGPQQVVTVTSGEDTYLLVFTSAEAMARQLVGVPAFNTTSYRELADKWPNPAWLLAVDPELPIQGYMPIETVAEGAAGRVQLPLVEPVPAPGAPPPLPLPADNELEADLAAAMTAGDIEGVIRTLVTSQVYLPTEGPVALPVDLEAGTFSWCVLDGAVPVFTSDERLREGPAVPPSVVVPFVEIVLAWPDPKYSMVVNPGSALELTFLGSEMVGLIAWAQELLPVAAGEPPAAGPVLLQKAVRPDEVDGFLQDGWRHVSGVVARADEPPAGGRPGHVVRWPAYVEELYRPAPSGGLHTHAVELPHGATLYRRDGAGREAPLASYDADIERWVPVAAAGDALRGVLSG